MAQWILIAGPKRSNKTSHVLELAKRFVQVGVSVGGFAQVRDRKPEGFQRYELMRLRTGERVPLAGDQLLPGRTDGEYFCSLAFQMDSFAVARRWLEADAKVADVLFIGDVSKFEVARRGHFAALTWALALESPKVISISARSDQLFYIVEKFGIEDNGLAWLELPAHDDECERFYAKALSKVARREPRNIANEGKP